MPEKDKTSNWLIPLPEKYAAEDKIIERPLIVFSVVLFVILAFAGLFWYGYMGRNDDGPIPVILAEGGAIKIQPIDSGGLKVKNQDKNIYDRLEGKVSDSGEKLRISSENPIDVPVKTTITENLDSYLNFMTSEDVDGSNIWLLQTKQPSETARSVVISKPAIIEKNKAVIVKGSYVIQLGAYGDKVKAKKLWKTLQKRYGAVNSLQLIFVPVKSGAKVIYRLQGGYFQQRLKADELCLMLKKDKQACISVEAKSRKLL
jgi:hypothetical protein